MKVARLLAALASAATTLAAVPALAQPTFGTVSQPTASAQVTPAQRQALLATVYRELQKSYVEPNKVPAIVGALRAADRKGAYATADSNEFARRLSNDLRTASGDGHLYIHWQPDQAEALKRDEATGSEDPGESYWRDLAVKEHHGIRRLEVLPGNVRYLKVSLFLWAGEATERAYDDAVRFLKDGNAIVIDLRGNGGGDPLAVRYLVSHFMPPDQLLMTFLEAGKAPDESRTIRELPAGRLTGKPLYVLTDKRCGSACEDFAYTVQQFRLGELIGATTAGAANNNRLVPIAPGFVLSVSYGRPVHPVSGTNWEGVGVKPDVETESAQALDVALGRVKAKLAAR